MNEEEKKAIKYFKALDKLTFEPYLSILLKLVTKQQKEIKELEVCLQAEEKYAEGLNNDIKSLLNIEPNNNFVCKDKIREIMRKDRDCLTFGYHSAYVGLLDDLIRLIEEE